MSEFDLESVSLPLPGSVRREAICGLPKNARFGAKESAVILWLFWTMGAAGVLSSPIFGCSVVVIYERLITFDGSLKRISAAVTWCRMSGEVEIRCGAKAERTTFRRRRVGDSIRTRRHPDSSTTMLGKTTTSRTCRCMPCQLP